MSQSIQQQQGTVLTEQQHVQGACSGQGGGDGVKPHLCVFQSLVMLSPGSCRGIQSDPQGTAGAQGLCAAASSSLPQHRRGHPLHPNTAQLTTPSASQYKEGRKPPGHYKG